MPRKVDPTPELAEPYEQYLYAELRHELVLRGIRIGNGPQRITKRTGFIAALRKWDNTRGQPTPPQPQEKASRTRTSAAKKTPAPRKTPQKAHFKKPPTTAMTSTRVVRARRGCRFRLINVLLSADFSGRWAEMLADGRLEVNQLWLDVHAAFLSQNSQLDTLHFEDALFVNVTPNVILTHSAERLLHMWAEIVAMYRTAVAQAKDAAAHNDNVRSFFDFCAGRLDLLYLHMAMLLEPKLYEFIMSDKIPSRDPFTGVGKATASATTTAPTVTATPTPAEATKAKQTSKSGAAAKATTRAVAKAARQDSKLDAAVTSATPAPAKAVLVANSASASAPAAPPMTATVAAPAMVVAASAAPITHARRSRVPTQNPEMEEAPEPVSAKGPTTAKPTAAKATKARGTAKQVKPTAPPHKLAAHKQPQSAAGKGKAMTGTSPANDTKQTAFPSKRKQETALAKHKAPSQAAHSQAAHAKAPSQTAHAKAPNKPSSGKSSPGAKPASASKPANGKRRREEEDAMAIVEVPSVSDIVPHSGKRAHTTTISTLATRPSDAMLPPDEWDILENRLRKVNENIDRCHRGLASVEGTVSENYKQSLEADLRFYSAIKQRLQEQLLVVMQSGY